MVATEGNPLAVGELRAAREDAPTVLIYGHYDVQSVGDPAAWTTPPFEPDVRDGRVYARGASDDKGNFLPLLHVACAQAAAGALPVNVRVLVEGEEETGGEAVAHWVRADERGADCAIVFDSGMVDEHTPAITIGLRGLVMLHLQVRTAERDMHSGVYGGSALNALHALHTMLGAVVPGPDGRLREELLAGVAAPAKAERDSWARLPPGDERAGRRRRAPGLPGRGRGVLRAQRRRAVAGDQRHPRRRAPHGGARRGARERLAAPGTRPDAQDALATLERLLRDALPPGAELELTAELAEPSLFPPDNPAVALSAQALERAVGAPTAFVRTGGSIPVVAEFAARDIPVVVSGFGLEDDAYHAPDESFRLLALDQGAAAADELYQALAAL